jgi:hypothetical protein
MGPTSRDYSAYIAQKDYGRPRRVTGRVEPVACERSDFGGGATARNSDQGRGVDLMDPLAWALRSLLSQDVARSNAATAAARLMDRRQEHADVDAYLAQRLDVPVRAGAKG